ncbi:MAG: hypothetical protein ACK55X_01205 [Synechococcaceae cyanobacterium]
MPTDQSDEISVRNRQRDSGAGLLEVATKGCDLVPQLLRASEIATREGHRQGELQLFALMITLGQAALGRLTSRQACG